MTDADGKPTTLKELIAEATNQFLHDDGSLLRDMKEQLPDLRLAVLGGHRQNHNWPAGVLRISRSHGEICVVLEIPLLEVERRVHGSSIYGCFDIMDEDLRMNPGGWSPNWKGRQRLERSLLT